MKDKAMSWLMLVVMVLLCSIIFMGAMLIHSAASAEERATFTDKDGHFAGSSVTRGNQTTITDRNGFFQGTITRQSTDSSRPLGNVDGSKPFGSRR